MQKRPPLLYLLLVLLILLALGGFAGGIQMLLDPSGESMGLSTELLQGLPIDTFFLPALFLILVMGCFPLIISYAIWVRKPWAWSAALAQAVTLILWILFQILLWGSPIFIQYLYLVWGILLLALCVLPTLKNDLR